MAKPWRSTDTTVTYDGNPIAEAATPEAAAKIAVAHNRTVTIINNVEWSSFHGCFQHNCPHEEMSECLAALKHYHESLGRMVLEQ